MICWISGASSQVGSISVAGESENWEAGRAQESGQRKSLGKEETAFPPLRSSTELPNIGDNSRVLGPKVARAFFLSAPLFVGLLEAEGTFKKKFQKAFDDSNPIHPSLSKPTVDYIRSIIKRSDASRISRLPNNYSSK